MFNPDLGKDRRHNLARHRADVTYDVSWDEELRAFGVFRNGDRTDISSRDVTSAIALAVGQAERDYENGLGALVFSLRDGVRSVEWPQVIPPAA